MIEGYKSLFENKIILVHPDKLEIEIYNEKIVDKYVKYIKNGKKIMPIFVGEDDVSYIVDGNHRAAAFKRLNKKVPIVKIDRVHYFTITAKPNWTPERYYKEFIK